MSKKILVTGGAGYIGSHICVELLTHGYEVMIFDNLSYGSKDAIKRVEKICKKKINFFYGDIRDEELLRTALCEFKPQSVLHFAGLKSSSESVSNPLGYYSVNLCGSINLLKLLSEVKCNEIIFSSSATVYANDSLPPYREIDKLDPLSPYGRSKHMFEMILKDWVYSNNNNRALSLRYFNPVGAHESGLIGESPKNTPDNLMPIISQVAIGKQDYLKVFGNDYSTRDGTGERDYIHIMDLSRGHVQSLEKICELDRFQVLNLGSGKGTTVLELVNTFEKSNNVNIPLKIEKRRYGDVDRSLADPIKANNLINFKCQKSIKDMCLDTWNWQMKNPHGYNN